VEVQLYDKLEASTEDTKCVNVTSQKSCSCEEKGKGQKRGGVNLAGDTQGN